MGLYLNKDSKGNKFPEFRKADFLIADGAEKISPPIEFSENLVCVVTNAFFEAAGYCFSENEMNVFKKPDGRPKVWLKYPHAKELAE